MSARHRLYAILSLIFLVGNAATVASADPKDQKPRKPSSFAPHHTGKHVYGAPIQRPILHKRHKASHNAPKSAAAQLPDSGVH